MPKPAAALPPQDELRRMFSYDENSGELRWRRREEKTIGDKIFNGKCGGKIAGYLREGIYISVNLGGVCHYAHRIIWKMMTGFDAAEWIDHIDGNGSNNKWINLRAASHSENMRNSKTFHNNTSGYRCVSFIKSHGKFRAAICVGGGKKKHIGYFDSAAEAHLAAADAILKTRGEFARIA